MIPVGGRFFAEFSMTVRLGSYFDRVPKVGVERIRSGGHDSGCGIWARSPRGRVVKPLSPKRFSWAGLLASGFVIVSGFVSSLFVILAFSDSQGRDIIIVAVTFVCILLVPILAMRGPRDPVEKVRRSWWKFWRRRKSKPDSMQKYWKRRRGQERNLPFGHRKIVRSSTFVAAPRKPTEP